MSSGVHQQGLSERGDAESACESACADSVDLALMRMRVENRRNDNNSSSGIDLFSYGGGSASLMGDNLSLSDFDLLPEDYGTGDTVRARKPASSVVLMTKKAAEVALARRRTRQAAMRQAAPMVLNLESMVDSTPEVLERELGRMTLDELLDLDARVNATAIDISRHRV